MNECKLHVVCSYFQAWKEVGRRLLDGKWHNIMVVVDSESGVLFYYDSDHIGTNRFA
jgi:hypothetical protein